MRVARACGKDERARSGRREMGPQLLAAHGGGVSIDQDEGEHARGRPVVDPGVHRAALDDDIAAFQVRHLTAVEFQVPLARQQRGLIGLIAKSSPDRTVSGIEEKRA